MNSFKEVSGLQFRFSELRLIGTPAFMFPVLEECLGLPKTRKIFGNDI